MINNATDKYLVYTLLRLILRSRRGMCSAICTGTILILNNFNILFIWSIWSNLMNH